RLAFRALEIQRDRALVGIHQGEGEAEGFVRGPREYAHAVAVRRRFDLDHVGAQITEQHCGVGAVVVMRQVKDAEIVQRHWRHGDLPSTGGVPATALDPLPGPGRGFYCRIRALISGQNSGLLELLDAITRIAKQRLEDLFRIGAADRRRLAYRARRAGHLPRNTGVLALADLRMLELDDIVALGQVRIFGDILGRHRGEGRDANALQLAGHVPAILLAGPARDDLVKRDLVPFAQRGVAEPWILRQPRLIHRSAERAPFVLGADRDRDPLVVAGRAIGFVRRHHEVVITVAHRFAPRHFVHQQPFRHQRERGLELRLIDILSLARERAPGQRRQDREGPKDASIGIGIGDPDFGRIAVAIAGAKEHPGSRGGGGAIADKAFERTGLAIAGHRDHDEVRLELAQLVVTEPELVHHAGGEVVGHDVAMLDQLAGDRDRVRIGEIHQDAFLALIVLVEVARAVGPHDAVGERGEGPRHARPERALILDHFRAEIGELQVAEGSRPGPGEVEYANSGKWRISHRIILQLSGATGLAHAFRRSWRVRRALRRYARRGVARPGAATIA